MQDRTLAPQQLPPRHHKRVGNKRTSADKHVPVPLPLHLHPPQQYPCLILNFMNYPWKKQINFIYHEYNFELLLFYYYTFIIKAKNLAKQ